MADPRSRLEPFLLCWGITYLGVQAGQLALEWRDGPLLGPWSAALALGAAATVGSLAAALLGSRLEPPDRRGGAWVLGLAAVVATGAGWAFRPAPPPAEFWSAMPGVVVHRAWWIAALGGVAALSLLPRLAYPAGAPFEHGRLHRALGFWLAAAGPPVAALVLLRAFPLGLANWFWALLLPHGLLLATLGVRVEERRLNRRGTRARLAGVSWATTVLLLCGGFLRELAS